jgi:hypothetical protein
MAVYKIFPTQDTTLYSSYPLMNTGLDAMLEVSNKLNIDGNPGVARYLVQFDQDEIQDIKNNKIGNNQYNIYLKNFIATAQGVNQNTKLEILPIAQQWNNGTGYYLDNPQEQDGASWIYSNYSGSGPWSPSGSYPNVLGQIFYTSSFNNSYVGSGGGNWFYDASGSLYVVIGYVLPGYVITQLPFSGSSDVTFGLRDNKDIEANVSNIVNAWISSSIPNYGFIVKLTGSQEFNSSQYIQPIFKYYSVDTNTIYPPCLEFRWRDYTSISLSSSSIVNTPNLKLSLSENPESFTPDSVNRFYVNVSPLYPTRVYQTSSLFTNLNYLPTSSYYAVKDLATNEFVINFDEQYTQISADNNGNYFDIYMSGLEPERYYKMLIKTIIGGSTLIFDDDYYFKVIN